MTNPDITVTRNGELMVAGIQGENYDGIEYVDALMPPGEYTVADSGHIVVPDAAADAIIEAARSDGFVVEETRQ